MKNDKTKRMVGLGLFTAIVVVLQLLGSFIRFGTFSVSLVLVPLVVGAALYGVGAGAWLGAVFGFAVLASGDAALFWAVNVPGTLLTVMAKGILAGLAAGAVYRLLAGKSALVATVAAALACPLVNTGVFLLGCRLFFFDTIAAMAENAGFAGSTGAFLIVGMVGLNFVAELVFNIVLSPAIVRLVQLGKKR